MKTPKAPPDIDEWMVDPPNLNQTESTITTGKMTLAPRQSVDEALIPVSNLNLPDFQPSRLSYVLITVLVLGAAILLLYLSPKTSGLLRAVWTKYKQLCDKLATPLFRLLMVSPTIRVLTFVMMLYDSWSIWNSYYEFSRWNITADFLATCKLQKVGKWGGFTTMMHRKLTTKSLGK